MSPTALKSSSQPQMPCDDEEIGRVLSLDPKGVKRIKHEIEEDGDRMPADEYYDAVAMAFLVEVAPLILRVAVFTSGRGLESDASTGAIQTPRELAKQVHDSLDRHLASNREIPIELPADYPHESIPHLRSVTRRLWVYLVRDVVLNTSLPVPDRSVALVASFLREFLAYARKQPSWSSWEKQTDDDLRLSWVLGDFLGETPPWYVQPAEPADAIAADANADVEAYGRSAKFSAYLVREGIPYHVSFWQHIVFALGEPGRQGTRSPKEANYAILALPAIFRIAGDVLYRLCNGSFEGEELYKDLEETIKETKKPLADYSSRHWTYWRAESERISSSEDESAKVRSAAKEIGAMMKSLDEKWLIRRSGVTVSQAA